MAGSRPARYRGRWYGAIVFGQRAALYRNGARPSPVVSDVPRDSSGDLLDSETASQHSELPLFKSARRTIADQARDQPGRIATSKIATWSAATFVAPAG